MPSNQCPLQIILSTDLKHIFIHRDHRSATILGWHISPYQQQKDFATKWALQRWEARNPTIIISGSSKCQFTLVKKGLNKMVDNLIIQPKPSTLFPKSNIKQVTN